MALVPMAVFMANAGQRAPGMGESERLAYRSLRALGPATQLLSLLRGKFLRG
jgi:hypothetical protein